MKIKGEQIDLLEEQSEEIVKLKDEEINAKYLEGAIRIVTEQARYPLDTIEKMVNGDDYRLDPEFQRRRQWNRVKQSRLIESFIMNVPIPPIFLYEDSYSHYEVMDGLQRLTAISEFYSNKFRLEGLEEWPELNGYKYSELPGQIKKGIDRRYLSSIILLYETTKDDDEQTYLKQMVFERINSGGQKLSNQESRNALYNGSLNEACKELSKNKRFRKMWGIPYDDDPILFEDYDEFESEALRANKQYAQMYDVELVLRFFAYRQKQRGKPKGLKTLLDQYLMAGNKNYSIETIEGLKELFIQTIDLVYEVMGPTAFYMYKKRKKGESEDLYLRNSATTTMYDCVMNVFSKKLASSEILKDKAETIQEELKSFFKENYDEFEGRNVNENTLKKREKLFESYINKFLEE